MGIVERIKQECKIKNITIASLEQQNGLSGGAISKWNNSIPSADKLYKISQSLNISMEYLISGKDKIHSLSEDEEQWLSLLKQLSIYDPVLKKSCIAFIPEFFCLDRA